MTGACELDMPKTYSRLAAATFGVMALGTLGVTAHAAEIKVLSGNGARVEGEASRALLRFLTAPAAAPVLRAAGIEPFVE